jgi:hypothetical protein
MDHYSDSQGMSGRTKEWAGSVVMVVEGVVMPHLKFVLNGNLVGVRRWWGHYEALFYTGFHLLA